MPGDDESSSSDTDKIFGITNIKSFISVTLNMEEHNYALWRLMFEMHCTTWEVDGYLDGTTVPKGPGDKAWIKRDNLIKMWIYNTIAPSLLQMVMKKGDTATQLWTALEKLFQSNKDARAMQINEDLRNTRLGDLTIEAYCHKMKVFYDLLENIGEPIAERTLVMHTINGLSEKFGNIATFIRHQKPLPTFLDTRAMLELEETRIKSTAENAIIKDSPSSPTVLHIQGNTPTRNSQENRNFIPQVCRNFYRGNCSYGEKCKFLHVSPNNNNQRRNSGGNTRHNTAGNYAGNPSHNQVKQNSILGHPPTQPVYYYSTNPPMAQTHFMQGPLQPNLPPGFSYQSVGSGVQQASGQQASGQQQVGMNNPVFNGQAMHVQQNSNDQPTTLPQVFANMTFKDGGDWYMDTGATSHLTTDAGTSEPKRPTSL